MNLISEVKLSNILDCHKVTLKKYLCRSEFSHIKRIRITAGKYIYKNIGDSDIEKLKELIKCKYGRNIIKKIK